ncbi:glycosyltransferase family 61 protein [Neisseria perflava]|uniref:glycosyltransferase family 61 protein n=1 Tax=Neisseria perflava TaxID=33053 RepID=UPI00209ECA53|nr:glycosyltransferase 61 family protein [Neisseria perflava]MCP1659292.1 hypothetical protein [Neisseria perflava]MCP1772800.1 hypothetical protein [Neisseria perflava]
MTPFKKNLYGSNLPMFEQQIARSYLHTNPLGIQIIDNGYILPLIRDPQYTNVAIYKGGVCDGECQFVAGYQRHNSNTAAAWQCLSAYAFSPSNTDFSEDEVIFGGIAFSQFGHFLIETLSRMWWVAQNKVFDKKIVFLKNKLFDHSHFIAFLVMMGIPQENIIFLEKTTRFRKIYVPDQAVCFHSFFNQEYAYPYNLIRENVKPASDKKIYLSRTQFSRGNTDKKDCINEEYFENFYRELGYRIIYPEQLSLQEQVSIISGAEEIVCTVGTLSHMALFANEQTRLVILLRSRSSLTIPQLMINEVKKLNAVFVDVSCNFLPNRHFSYCFYIGPNQSWQEFVREEYHLDIDVDLYRFLDSEHSQVGDYMNLWLRNFSQPAEFQKIKEDTVSDELSTLETIFSSDSITADNSIVTKLKAEASRATPEYALLKNKLFLFSRFNGSHSRVLYLAEDGIIHTVGGNGNANEAFWRIENNVLVFRDKSRNLTSTYFHLDEKRGFVEAYGYYERNKSIMFKLREMRAVLPDEPPPVLADAQEEADDESANSGGLIKKLFTKNK